MSLKRYDKIVILGAGGILGEALFEYFLKENFKVIGISRRPGPSVSHVLDLGFPSSYQKINTLVSEETLVLFLAGQSSKQGNFMHWTENKNLLSVCLSNLDPVSKFIFFSSVDAISNDNFPIELTSMFWAHYGYSKGHSEKLIEMHNLDILRVYPFFHNDNSDLLKRCLRIPILKIGLRLSPDVLIEYDDISSVVQAVSDFSGPRKLGPKMISQNELCVSRTKFSIPISQRILKELIGIIILFQNKKLRPYFRAYLYRKLGL